MKIIKHVSNVLIPANTKLFYPNVVFAEGDHDGTRIRHIPNFKETILDASKIVTAVDRHFLIKYESNTGVHYKKVYDEIGQWVVAPDQLWVAWKNLIFKQSQGQEGQLKVDGSSNCWFVQCYDKVIRLAVCLWSFNEWMLECTDIGECFANKGSLFFEPQQIL